MLLIVNNPENLEYKRTLGRCPKDTVVEMLCALENVNDRPWGEQLWDTDTEGVDIIMEEVERYWSYLVDNADGEIIDCLILEYQLGGLKQMFALAGGELL